MDLRRTQQRGEGLGVVNHVDRGRDDAVVDDVDKMSTCGAPTPGIKKDKKSTKPTTRTLQQLQPERKPTTAMTMATTKWAMPGRPSLHHWPTGIRQDAPIDTVAVGNSTSRKSIVHVLTTL